MSDSLAMSSAKSRLIEHLLAHSVRTGDFVMKSGQPTTWFIDSKQTACDPLGIQMITELALELIPESATAIGGMTVGADPVAYGVAAVAGTRGRMLRSFTIRKEAKDHGVQGRVAGALRPGDEVVVCEDTVTRGSTLADAVNVIREFGARPVMMLAVVDRGGSCERIAAELGLGFAALVTAPDLGFEYEGGLT